MNLRRDLGILRRVWAFMRPYRFIYGIGAFLFVTVGIVGSVNMGTMVRSLTEAHLTGSLDEFYRAIVRCLLLTLTVMVGLTAQIILYNYSKTCMEVDLATTLIVKTLRTKMSVLIQTNPGELLSQFNNDVRATLNVVGNGLVHMMSSFMGGIIMVGVIALMSWEIALFALAVGLLNVWISAKIAPKQRELSSGFQKSLAAVAGLLNEVLTGSCIIRLFDLRKTIVSRAEGPVSRSGSLLLARQRITCLSDLAAGLINVLGVAGTLIVGVVLHQAGRVALPDVLGSVMLAGSVGGSFTNGASKLTDYQKALAAAELVLDSLDVEEEDTAFGTALVDHSCPQAIDIRGLSCFYKDRSPALSNVSLSVRRHQFIGLVGLSGGGKSTLFKALMQFVDYQGDMAVFGRPVREYALASLRGCMAYVAQETVLFDDTIAVNIGYGKAGASQEDIVRAAKLAYAYDFIMEMPDGFDTVTGERGVQLSGGQRQRIAIARAFLMDAPLLLLDEATSALDSQSEVQVQRALEHLMEGRTILSAAHRLSTIQNADEILVFDKGAIAERGTHEELLALGGRYAGLYKAQAGKASEDLLRGA